MAEGAGLDAPITGVTVFTEGARAAWWRGEPGARAVAGSDWHLPATVDPDSGHIAARGRDLALVNAEVHRRYRADPLRGKPRGCVRRSKGAATLSRRLTMRTRHRPQLGGTDRSRNWPLRGAVWT